MMPALPRPPGCMAFVVTRNVKDFEGRGVTLLDPFKAARRSRA